jgi:lysozyme
VFRGALTGMMWLFLGASVFAQESDTIEPFRAEDQTASRVQLEGIDGNLPAAAEDPLPPRKFLRVAVGLIKTFEGWDPDIYDDPSGYCTIGFGHLVAKATCAQLGEANVKSKLSRFSPLLTLATGQELLINDTIPARRTVQRLVNVQLTDRQFGALTSFVFNVGARAFSKSTLLKHLNTGNYDAAAREFPKWVLSNKVKLNGLVTRRYCEQNLFRERGRLRSNGLFITDNCLPLSGLAPDSDELVDITTGED